MGTVNFPRTSAVSEPASEILLNISGSVHCSLHSDVYERRAIGRFVTVRPPNDFKTLLLAVNCKTFPVISLIVVPLFLQSTVAISLRLSFATFFYHFRFSSVFGRNELEFVDSQRRNSGK